MGKLLTHLALFGEIEKTVAKFDDRLIGGIDIKDGQGKIVGVSPRLYFVRDIGKSHLVTVSVEPKNMLLTWTHMTPSKTYMLEIYKREKAYLEKMGAYTAKGEWITTFSEYEKKKRKEPLYLATALNSKRLLHQSATSSVTSIIAQSDEKVKGLAPAIREEIKRKEPLYLATALGQQNPSHQAADSVATGIVAQSGKKIKGLAPGKQQEKKTMNENCNGEKERPERVLRVGIFNARLVGFGDGYGRDEKIKYEEAVPMLEFYDARQDKEKFGRFGQFVSRYDLPHIQHQRAFFAFGGMLALDGGVSEWMISGKEMDTVLAWTRTQLSAEEKQALACETAQSNSNGIGM